MNKTYNKFIDFIKLSIMGESILEKAEGRVSYHDSVEEMLKRIREDGMSNVFDRWIEQEKIRCKFCLQGLSCQLCSQGPCRINEKGPQKKVYVVLDQMLWL
ncbi:carbon monoxide dehydrogenase [Clostridium botulinum CFSAN002367]|nr:carbon monoxide dehydrogenase [Clostridium botulinum CFSAN002367]